MLGRKPKRPTAFVTLSMVWIKRLAAIKHVATYQLNWKQPGAPITVSNVALRDWGITCRREQKREGLRELEKLGLIRVECKGKASPTVKLLL
jgi:hypothetical protein